jgi:hypothetical protein
MSVEPRTGLMATNGYPGEFQMTDVSEDTSSTMGSRIRGSIRALYKNSYQVLITKFFHSIIPNHSFRFLS